EIKVECKVVTTEDGHTENDLSVYFKHPNFHMAGWIATHIAIKHVYNLLYKKLKVFVPENRQEILDIAKAVTSCGEYLHHHHDHEEELVWDWLKEKKPESKEFLGTMDHQHGDWVQKNKEISDLITSIKENENLKDSTSEGWSETLEKLQSNIKNQIALIYEHFYDEERLILPIAINIPKADQIKIGDIIHERIKKESSGKFGLGAMLDASNHNKAMADSLNKAIPWFVRKVIFPLAIKKDYKWFTSVVEIK
ncbi:hypothetical protein DICPUDRAFT_20741, partial [Dictyostelium purpureum]